MTRCSHVIHESDPWFEGAGKGAAPFRRGRHPFLRCLNRRELSEEPAPVAANVQAEPNVTNKVRQASLDVPRIWAIVPRDKRRRSLRNRDNALNPFAVGADPADPQRVLVRDSHASRAGCEGRASVTESGATCRRVLPAWAISGEAGR
jgi:hypothetical protein